jgi:hypothetical protein
MSEPEPLLDEGEALIDAVRERILRKRAGKHHRVIARPAVDQYRCRPLPRERIVAIAPPDKESLPDAAVERIIPGELPVIVSAPVPLIAFSILQVYAMAML